MAETVAARGERAARQRGFACSAASNISPAQRLAAVGSWESDPRTGTVEWSDEYYRILGVSRDTFQPNAGGVCAHGGRRGSAKAQSFDRPVASKVNPCRPSSFASFVPMARSVISTAKPSR